MGQRPPHRFVILSRANCVRAARSASVSNTRRKAMLFPPLAPKTLVFATAALGALFAQGAAAMEPTANVIEYYNASLNHFFITAYQDEAAMLDQGLVIKGWTR